MNRFAKRKIDRIYTLFGTLSCFFLLSVNFAQPKQEKFNISNSPEYPSKLFHFGIKRFRRRICTPVVEIIQDSLIVILKSFWSR